jgi:hypothetical protein
LQVWLAANERDVTIPYAEVLAGLIPPVAVRLRRDFRAVLALIRAHALLHQTSRARDRYGRIVATLDDYSIVRDLVGDLVAEGVEATVPPGVRETVSATVEIALTEGVSLAQLATALGIDKSAASRRWNEARRRGYLKNLEERRGKPARIVIGDPLPRDVDVLPAAETLKDRCTIAGVQPETEPPPRHPDRAEEQST